MIDESRDGYHGYEILFLEVGVVAPDRGVFCKCGRHEYGVVSIRVQKPGLTEIGLDFCEGGRFVLDEIAVFVDLLLKSFGSD